MMIVSLIMAFILSILSVIMALQNSGEITVKFFVWQFQGPMALFLLATLIAGCVVGLLVMLPGQMRSNRALKRLKAEGKSEAHPQPERSNTSKASS